MVPIVFEIPIELSDKKDVLVVWEAWRDIRSEDRSSIILEAYGEDGGSIAQALGVTYDEAIEQQVLPYAVQPMNRRGEADPEAVRNAMIRQGGILFGDKKVDLRFPSLQLAQDAFERLVQDLPTGYWSIVQTNS